MVNLGVCLGKFFEFIIIYSGGGVTTMVDKIQGPIKSKGAQGFEVKMVVSIFCKLNAQGRLDSVYRTSCYGSLRYQINCELRPSTCKPKEK